MIPLISVSKTDKIERRQREQRKVPYIVALYTIPWVLTFRDWPQIQNKMNHIITVRGKPDFIILKLLLEYSVLMTRFHVSTFSARLLYIVFLLRGRRHERFVVKT